MEFFIYNTMVKRKEVFKSIVDGKVSMYTCGPTVYDFSHIGNFRTFIFEDLLKRWLLHLGYDVTHVMNITDVDDKTIKKSISLKLGLEKITNKYISEFMSDITWLNLHPADYFPRATDHVLDMISMINNLIKNKMAYVGEDGSVYFDISSFKNYGKLARIQIKKDQKRKIRGLQDEYNSNSPQDFALWKARKANDGDVFWDSPWGEGRPGWHIECSAMSTKILGNHFDIHCGGVDNIFPHHENELAQSVGANGKNFVNYWVHSEHLMIDGEKMSKSKINFYTLKDLKEKGFTSQSIRYQLLSGHYRTKISFSLKKKYESDKIINRITDFYLVLKKMGASEMSGNELPEAYEKFQKCLNNDLDTPGAIAVFLGWMKHAKKKFGSKKDEKFSLRAAWNFTCIFDSIFKFIKKDSLEVDSIIKALLLKRKESRKNKDWDRSDFFRREIFKHGWIVEDTKDGQKLRRK